MAVDVEQFLAQSPPKFPPGMVSWEAESARPRDMSWGYVDLPTRRVHVCHGDWVVYEDGKPVGVSRTSPLPPLNDLCALCGNAAKDHYSEEGHAITTCIGFEALPRPVRELITRLRADERVVNWLEENLVYAMVAVRGSASGGSESLHNNGRGWKNGELRAAVARQIAEEAL